jgi:hypothetical protein
LLGLKENVILGRLIPAGTGYRTNGSDFEEPNDSYENIRLRASVNDEENSDEADDDEEMEKGSEK